REIHAIITEERVLEPTGRTMHLQSIDAVQPTSVDLTTLHEDRHHASTDATTSTSIDFEATDFNEYGNIPISTYTQENFTKIRTRQNASTYNIWGTKQDKHSIQSYIWKINERIIQRPTNP